MIRESENGKIENMMVMKVKKIEIMIRKVW